MDERTSDKAENRKEPGRKPRSMAGVIDEREMHTRKEGSGPEDEELLRRARAGSGEPSGGNAGGKSGR